MPVELNVLPAFLAMSPALPIPVVITLPLQARIQQAAVSNLSSKRPDKEAISLAAMSSTDFMVLTIGKEYRRAALGRAVCSICP